MYFYEDDPLCELERLMQRIPNFSPRGCGVVILSRHEYDASDCNCRNCLCHAGRGRKMECTLERDVCLKERIEAGATSYRETIAETMSSIRYPPFILRLNRYLKESEEPPMYFKNEKHRTVFAGAVRKLDRKNYALMAVIYLLTADRKLWNMSKHCVGRNEIRFAGFRLHGSTENGYALYCAAKDLYLGTKNLTIRDLSDTGLIPPKLFGLICNGMAIRRFGLGAVKFHPEKEKLPC